MGNLLSCLPTLRKKKNDDVHSVPDENIHNKLSRATKFKQTKKNDPDDMIKALNQGTETDDFQADVKEATHGDVAPMDKAKPDDIIAVEPDSKPTEKLPRSFLGRLLTKNQGNGEKWRRDRMVGKVVGSYTIGERLCKGGTSVIYLTENLDSEEMVQLMTGQYHTILTHEALIASSARRPSNLICKITDGKYRDGLQKEFDVLKIVEHPNIVTVFDCISLNKVVAMVMEYVRKLDLHDFIIQNWPIAPATRKIISSQLLSAVAAIHTKGIAHCDIKLENILIDHLGDVKMIDFSSALKVSEASFNSFKSIANTPEYLPPEIMCSCADWGSYDIRAIDQWSVGIVLFLLLTGRFPFGEVDGLKKYINMLKTSPAIELRQNEKHLLFSEKGYIDKVRGLLQFNHPNRIPIAKVLEMPYCKKIDMESLIGHRSLIK